MRVSFPFKFSTNSHINRLDSHFLFSQLRKYIEFLKTIFDNSVVIIILLCTKKWQFFLSTNYLF